MQNNITGYAISDMIESRCRVVDTVSQGRMGQLYRVTDVGRGDEELRCSFWRKWLPAERS